MSSVFNQFKNLHDASGLFVLPNVWNAKSALLFEAAGFPAIGTSSLAVADSIGYGDGEGMPFHEYLFIIKRILSSVKIPVTVDLEMGYGKTQEAIWSNIRQLVDLGVAGINLEDSVIDGTGRTLKDAQTFAGMISYLKNRMAAENAYLFLNVRCDTFILHVENKLPETLQRLKIYEAAGADGIFLPCIASEEDIAAVTSNTRMPLNVMCIPGLPGFDTLNKLGVKRASMGPFLYNKLYNHTTQLSKDILAANSFSAILS